MIEWGSLSGLKFNDKKTEVIMFHNKPRWKPERFIRINGANIQYSNSAKYLGVTMDRRLNWTDHITNKTNKARKHLYLLKNIMNTKFGPSAKMLRWAYTGIVRPGLMYGCHVWANNLKVNQVKMLEKINRLGCLLIAPVKRSTPTKALEIIYNLEPLDLLTQQMAINTWQRIKKQIRSCWSGYGKKRIGHMAQLEKSAKLYGLKVNDDSCLIKNPSQKFSTTINWNYDYQEHKNIVYCYTDGSKIDNMAGYGYYIRHKNLDVSKKSGRISDYSTVFQAEIKAVLEASIYIRSLGLKNEKIRFRVDNQAAIKALKSKMVTSKLVFNCIKELNKLGKRNNLKLEWVKAHSKTTPYGNDMADLLAKEGTSLDTLQAEVIPVPVQHNKALVKEITNNKWQRRWQDFSVTQLRQSEEKLLYRQTKIFIRGPSEKLHRHIINQNRTQIRKLIGFITGHNNLKYHQKQQNIVNNDTCRLCGNAEEQSWHLLSKCPSLNFARSQIFHEYSIEMEDFKWEPKRIMNFIENTKVNDLLEAATD